MKNIRKMFLFFAIVISAVLISPYTVSATEYSATYYRCLVDSKGNYVKSTDPINADTTYKIVNIDSLNYTGENYCIGTKGTVKYACDTSELGNAIASQVLNGVTFSSSSGLKQTGTMAKHETTTTISDTTGKIGITDDGDYFYLNLDPGAYLAGSSSTTHEIKIPLSKVKALFPTPIDKSTSYIGKYADVDGDGEVDGVIFADLALDGSGSSSYTYSYSAVSNLKDYYVSQSSYEGEFGTSEVISPVSGTTGNDRFYIMALDNFATSSYLSWYWYYSATTGISDYATIVSNDFGTGKQNTATMISKWNDSVYGSQNAQDLWGAIQTKVNDGWFVPSRGEWNAIRSSLNISKTNYDSKGMSSLYWSSSLKNISFAEFIHLSDSSIRNNVVAVFNYKNYVRLVRTF